MVVSMNLYNKGRFFEMNIKPLADRVVIKREEAKEKTKSGIVLPRQSKKTPQIARVLAIFPSRYKQG